MTLVRVKTCKRNCSEIFKAEDMRNGIFGNPIEDIRLIATLKFGEICRENYGEFNDLMKNRVSGPRGDMDVPVHIYESKITDDGRVVPVSYIVICPFSEKLIKLPEYKSNRFVL